MMQSNKAKTLDRELWSLVGGGQHHTQQMTKIKYKQLMDQKRADDIEWLNRNSPFSHEKFL